MIYKLIQFLLLLLPFRLVIYLYKANKALPFNIKTRTGKSLKAVMVTDRYGILFTDKDYISNRVKLLRAKQSELNRQYGLIASEMNSLSMESRELFFDEEDK